VKNRFPSRFSRLGVILFTAAGVSALGCSLLVEFDESQIPGEDTGVVADTAVDTGTDTTPPDTNVEDSGADTNVDDTAVGDAGDTGAADAGDTGVVADSGTDTGTADTGTADTGTPDTGTPDTGTPDTGTPDTGTPDTGTPDTGTPDTGTPDTGTPDTGTPDTGTPDTGTPDTGTPDTGTPDTGTPDTGTPDTGTPDTGPDDTGAADSGADTSVDDASSDVGDTAPVTIIFKTELSGAQQNPAVTTTATGSATCTLTVGPTTNNLACTVTHSVSGPTAAHIHLGAFGINGGVEVPFAAATSPITETVTLSTAQITALGDGKLYINVHSGTFSGGEIRGQLVKSGETLYGARMAAASGSTAGTTPTGGFSFVLATDGTMRYVGNVSGLSAAPTSADIKDSSGVLKNLTTTGTPGASTDYLGSFGTTTPSGFLTGMDAGTDFVNLATAASTGGEASGTITKIFTAP